MTKQNEAEIKLARFVHNSIVPAINEFVAALSDDDLIFLLKNFKTMNIDLIKDLTKEAKSRKIQSNTWTEDSPFDDIIGDISK